MELRETSFSFPRLRGNGPQRNNQAVVFPRPVIRAVAAMTGYSMGFAGDDHHVGIVEAQLQTTTNANVVEIEATLGVRDWSGFWDDDYAGTITAAVLAELEDVTAPPARGDLVITGVETTQAIQSFRSAQHLDAANVLPDNAFPLVGGKATGLRFWVDYDADAGLPAIARVSGELVVRTGGTTTTLSPIQTIVPRRETEIERGQVSHTLNFRIPGTLCRGSVEIECRVFDVAASAQRSAAFRRTLTFVDVNPVRVYGVGVHYIGQGLDLPAPHDADMLSTLGYTVRTFPTGDVLLSGFTTIDFDDDLFTTDTSGCGDGFEALRGVLEDMRGDSDDLFYGLLPNGISFGTFIGCGGSGAGTGVVGDEVTAAHEAGHALGRRHAPCDSMTRCDTPSNQDGSYPRYGPFPSDSIGEFGYDSATDTVFDPAGSFDFMGYSGNEWISPYTYRALFSRMDPPFGGEGAAGETNRAAHELVRIFRELPRYGARRAQWQRVRVPRLMLAVDVGRDRSITVLPSFTFPAPPRRQGDEPTQFTAEIVGGDGKRRACEPLTCDCMTCREDCWPRHLRGEIPIDPADGETLRIYEGDQLLHETVIPAPPRLRCREPAYEKDGTVTLSWRIDADGGKKQGDEEAPRADDSDLWFLIHWRDEDGSWRGLGSRFKGPDAVIPARLRLARSAIPIRVLATNGLSTATCEVELRGIRGDPPITIVTSELGPGVVHAWAVDHLGRSLANPGLAWYDAAGKELARGSEMDLRRIGGGPQLVRVVAVNAGAGKAEREIVITGYPS